MIGLRGARVALLEARRASELAELVRRRDGVPISVPAVVERRTDARAEVEGLLDAMAGSAEPVLVFTTGVAVEALCQAATAVGRERELRALLASATLACRGPKPAAALARIGLRAAVQAAEPYTEAELLAALAPVRVEGRPTALLHHGERSPGLAVALAARGARLTELTLYAWSLPWDLRPLQELVRDLAWGTIDAVVFTSQIQARHLFAVAAPMDLEGALAHALVSRTVVASIGPTCTRVLRSLGIPPAVEPERPKMGPLVTALAEHLARVEAAQAAVEAP